jgi:hypothetical protein
MALARIWNATSSRRRPRGMADGGPRRASDDADAYLNATARTRYLTRMRIAVAGTAQIPSPAPFLDSEMSS